MNLQATRGGWNSDKRNESVYVTKSTRNSVHYLQQHSLLCFVPVHTYYDLYDFTTLLTHECALTDRLGLVVRFSDYKSVNRGFKYRKEQYYIYLIDLLCKLID